MQVKLSKLSGFCGGVNNTVNKAKELIEKNNNVYCLGQIVHNEEVVKELEKMGMTTINNIEDAPNNCKLIFRAHGEPKESYEKANQKGIEIIDLTCPKINVIREKIKKQYGKSFIIIIGKKTHPETIANISYCGENSYVIEEEQDIYTALEIIKKTNIKKIYIIAQTTISTTKFEQITELIKKIYKDYEITIDNTICNVTESRQNEVRELSTKVDKMIIIGGKNSSNTKELYNIASINCKDTFFVNNITDLTRIDLGKNDIIGIAAGASTPQKSIDEIYKYLNKKDDLNE